jgi:alkaline phosphatase D
MARISRRNLLLAASASTLYGAAAPTLAEQVRGQAQTGAKFRHGVASGDPSTEDVVLWTRLTGEVVVSDDSPHNGLLAGRWEVADDADFEQIRASGLFETSPARDHTVKVIAGGLTPGTAYHYRFIHGETVSPTGRTQTLPVGDVSELNVVLACCAMYMLGNFHAYRAIAELEAIDLVLFVGDYIYEYGPDKFGNVPDLRRVEPPHETVRLEDYRRRYAQWREDEALQAAHARAPWACTWDDHEMANDDWRGGAQNHDPASEGSWTERRRAAVRAYLEWMPVREPTEGFDIARSFSFGDLATLAIPETRLMARDRQLHLETDLDMHIVDARDPVNPRIVTNADELAALDAQALPDGYRLEPDIEGFRRKIADPGREMIGAAQRGWLGRVLDEHGQAGRQWFLFGSATIFSEYVYPDLTRFEGGSSALQSLYAMSRYGLPLLNLDAWDGYAAERDMLRAMFVESGANLLVLSGDSHMAWLNEPHYRGRRIGVEVSASTLTGPSLGELMLPKGAVGAAFAERNEDVVWCADREVGIVHMIITPQTAEARFLSVADPRGDGGGASDGALAVTKVARSHLHGDNGPSAWRTVEG